MELKIIPEKNGCRYLLCDAQGNYFEISKMAYDILSIYRKTNSYNSVISHLKDQYPEIIVTEADIQNSIDTLLSRISQQENASYLHKLFCILKPESGIHIYKLLTILFHPVVFLIFFVAGVISSLIYYYNLQPAPLMEHLPTEQIPVYYILFLAILFFHELGHASAAFSYGIQPKDIGFGLYFIFPVFFTNVTAAWELNTLKRTIVNIGGIYFQLLVNLVLIVLAWLDAFKGISQMLFIINSISIIVSLIPFLRYDGYWIVSDLCRIPNLRKKASALAIQVIAKPGEIKNYFLENKPSTMLTIYTMLNAVFWAALYLYMGNFINTTISSISQKHLLNDPNTAIFVVERVLILLFISTTISLAFFKFIKSIYYARTKQPA